MNSTLSVMKKVLTKKERSQNRIVAFDLVVKHGFQQKETAEILDISERTLSVWSKKYKWKDAINNGVKDENEFNEFIAIENFTLNFKKYVLKNSYKHYAEIDKLLSDFRANPDTG